MNGECKLTCYICRGAAISIMIYFYRSVILSAASYITSIPFSQSFVKVLGFTVFPFLFLSFLTLSLSLYLSLFIYL